MSIITRFAPSPTGYLHIGGARTALFNYYYTKHMKGKFLLRIEDTDKARSTKEAVDAIINGLNWLGINYDGDIVFQSTRVERHKQVAHEMVQKGVAYYCYTTPEELEKLREEAQKQGKSMRSTIWRDKDIKDYQPLNGKLPVIRLKAEQTGETVVDDSVLGKVSVKNTEIDDMILLRSDGTPTYMFAVVVDDHDMQITNVIRGDDHFTNTFRQVGVYKALGWNVPNFAHLPLIYGEDGKKLSKRRGAVAVEEWKDMGYTPEAMRNYLIRLGWGHNDDEIISDKQAIEWFDIKDVSKAPARFDVTKLKSINQHYMQKYSVPDVLDLIVLDNPFLENALKGRNMFSGAMHRLKDITPNLLTRTKTWVEFAEASVFMLVAQPEISESGLEIIKRDKELLKEQLEVIEGLDEFSVDILNVKFNEFVELKGIKLKQISEVMRVAITGEKVAPASNFDIMVILGKDLTVSRIKHALSL